MSRAAGCASSLHGVKEGMLAVYELPLMSRAAGCPSPLQDDTYAESTWHSKMVASSLRQASILREAKQP